MKIINYNKIKKFLKQTAQAIAKKPLEVILATALTATPIACGKHKKTPIPPQAPVFITETLPDAKENSLYSAFVQASDPQSDPITFSITGGTGDDFLDINSSTGELNGTPSDIESGTTHDLKVRATDDKSNFTEKTFLIYVINTENLTGNIKDVTNDTNLQGMQVKLGSNSALTDINGNYTFSNVEDGNYDTEINDNTGSETNYFTHKAGTLITNKQKNLEGKLNNDFKIIPTTLEAGDTKDAVLDHIANCIRTPYDAEKDIKKWIIRPIPKIYLRDFSTGNPVPVADIDRAKNWILNKLYLVDPLLSYVASDILEVDSTRPVGATPQGYFEISLNSAMGGGGNWQEFDGNEIISGFADWYIGAGDDIVGQELTENVFGGGEPSTAALFNYSTILDDPTTVSDYTTSDLKLWKIFQNKPRGNKDLDSTHNHDVNLSGYIINP